MRTFSVVFRLNWLLWALSLSACVGENQAEQVSKGSSSTMNSPLKALLRYKGEENLIPSDGFYAASVSGGNGQQWSSVGTCHTATEKLSLTSRFSDAIDCLDLTIAKVQGNFFYQTECGQQERKNIFVFSFMNLPAGVRIFAQVEIGEHIWHNVTVREVKLLNEIESLDRAKYCLDEPRHTIQLTDNRYPVVIFQEFDRIYYGPFVPIKEDVEQGQVFGYVHSYILGEKPPDWLEPPRFATSYVAKISTKDAKGKCAIKIKSLSLSKRSFEDTSLTFLFDAFKKLSFDSSE